MNPLAETTGHRLAIGVTALAGLLLLFTMPAGGAQRQALQGHVPAAVASLQPLGRLPATNRLVLTIGLPLRHQTELANLLERLCDPASPDYGRYLTPDQFAERFGPTEQDYQALIAFVKTNGLAVTGLHSNRTLLEVSGSVADIEQALRVTLRLYPHPCEARTFYAPEAEPSLDLAVPVLHISGLDNYLVPRPMSLRMVPGGSATGARPTAGSGPAGTYMGSDFRAAYVPGVSNLTGAGQVVGLLEFDGYYPGDITNYVAQAGLPNVPLKTVLLDGFNGAPGSANIEVSLDIDMAMSMAPGLSAVIVYEGLLADSILNRIATDNLAKQISASWTYSIDANTEQIFQQFAAQGQSFFNASGDSDAYVGAVDPPCDDPYITVVGGTTLTNATSGGAWVSETVWNWGSSTAPPMMASAAVAGSARPTRFPPTSKASAWRPTTARRRCGTSRMWRWSRIMSMSSPIMVRSIGSAAPVARRPFGRALPRWSISKRSPTAGLRSGLSTRPFMPSARGPITLIVFTTSRRATTRGAAAPTGFMLWPATTCAPAGERRKGLG